MMVRRWEDDWIRYGPVQKYMAVSRLFIDDELRALIQFHGTPQRHFYTVARFDNGVRSEVPGQFQSLEEAKASA
jgi:hypothetical protein